MKSFFSKIYIITSVVLSILLLSGCQDKNTDSGRSSDLPPKELRPSLATVLTPEASGVSVSQNATGIIDYSNTDQGYIIAQYTGASKKVKLLLIGPDSVQYQYLMDGTQQVFALTGGSGQYTVGIYENLTADQYNPTMNFNFNCELQNEFLPYLYPNIFVNFNSSTKAVSLGEEIASTATSELEVVENVYNYVIDLLEYDYDKADWVEMGYAPNPDETLETKTGICFDYTALMATMLRTQGIPTNLQVGWAGTIYHAWINVYIKDIGWINGIVQFDGVTWKRMDPTFADGESSSKSIMDFINSNENYKLKYSY